MKKKKTKKIEAVVFIAVMVLLTAASVNVEAEESSQGFDEKWE